MFADDPNTGEVRVQVIAVDLPQGPVSVFHALTPDGLACRVACESRLAAQLVARLEAEAHRAEPWRVYATVRRWQLI
jgi:hypothetical protein